MIFLEIPNDLFYHLSCCDFPAITDGTSNTMAMSVEKGHKYHVL
jgi:hypothetical protein